MTTQNNALKTLALGQVIDADVAIGSQAPHFMRMTVVARTRASVTFITDDCTGTWRLKHRDQARPGKWTQHITRVW